MAVEFGADDAGGIAAPHPPREIDEHRLAPTTSGAELNTIRPAIFPIACWRLDHIRFDFDSSFVRPQARKELKLLAELVRANPGAPLSIFGHADPVGKDDYNAQLSARRAEAIFGLLTRNYAVWEHLYVEPFGGDEWGLRSVQTMLAALQYDPGDIDGKEGPNTTDAISEFQAGQGIGQTGTLGTRTALFLGYMDFLCGAEFLLTPDVFLGEGKGAKGRAAYQGCGEFNAVLRFSTAREAEFQDPDRKADRDNANAPNRRVVVFLFRPGIWVDPRRWPCPSVRDGVAACRKRFWSDHEIRRSNQAKDRDYDTARDTFACRFYDRIAGASPCERPSVVVYIQVDVVLDTGMCSAEAGDSYMLFSTDVAYSRTLDCGSAVALNDSQLVLRFTQVLPGRSYTMVLHLGERANYALFKDAPASELDDHGAATSPSDQQTGPPTDVPEPDLTCNDEDFRAIPRNEFSRAGLEATPDSPTHPGIA